MSSTGRRLIALAALAGLIVAIYFALRDSPAENVPIDSAPASSTSPEPATLRTTGETVPPAEEETAPASTETSARLLVRAVDLSGRPIRRIALVVPESLRSVQSKAGPSPGSLIVAWEPTEDAPRVDVTSRGYLPTQLVLDPVVGPTVVVTLEGDPEAGMRRLTVTASLADRRYAVGAKVVATSKSGRMLKGTLDNLGTCRFDTGDEAGTVWPKVEVVWHDKYANEYRAIRSDVRIPHDLDLMLTTEKPSYVVMTLDERIPLPKRGHVEFVITSLDSGMTLGWGGQGGKRTETLRCSMPGRYRVVAHHGGAIMGQADFDVVRAEKHHVTIFAATAPDLVCTLSPDLASRFGSVLAIPQSLIAVANNGGMDIVRGFVMTGDDPFDTMFLTRRVGRTSKISENKVQLQLPERDSYRVYVLDKKGGLLARADVDLANERGGSLHLDLPRDAEPAAKLEVTLRGDLEPLAKDPDMTLTIWDQLGYRHRGPVSIKGTKLLLPPLPSGTYNLRFGKATKQGYFFPVTPYVIDVPAPPATTHVQWMLIWAK